MPSLKCPFITCHVHLRSKADINWHVKRNHTDYFSSKKFIDIIQTPKHRKSYPKNRNNTLAVM